MSDQSTLSDFLLCNVDGTESGPCAIDSIEMITDVAYPDSALYTYGGGVTVKA